MCEYDYGQDPAPDAAEQPDAGSKGFVCPPPPPTGGADTWVLSQEGCGPPHPNCRQRVRTEAHTSSQAALFAKYTGLRLCYIVCYIS